MYRIYCSTIEKLYWGRQYLTPDFFDLMRKTFKRNMVFIGAYTGRELVAGAFNLAKANVMYGRYWGCFQDFRFLHFNVCYYAGIEHWILHGIQRFEPGAGGEYKWLRGFDPALTRSMHYVSNPGPETRNRRLPETRAPRSRAMDRRRQRTQPAETAAPVRPGIAVRFCYAISRTLLGGAGKSSSGAGSPVRFVTRLRYFVRWPFATSNASCAFDSDLPTTSN